VANLDRDSLVKRMKEFGGRRVLPPAFAFLTDAPESGNMKVVSGLVPGPS
jgi:hypothetical protein